MSLLRTSCRAALLTALAVSASPLAAKAAQAETQTGYAVIEVASGKVLAAREVRQPFIPASVAKLPAAMVVLDRLPAETRLVTRLLATGPVDKKGTLNGNLLLVGGGDPSLVHDDLQKMAQALAKMGVKKVNGQFYYDGSALPTLPSIEPRQPDDASYNPPLGGLSVDFSRFQVNWPRGKDGSVKAPVGGELPLAPNSVVDVPATPPSDGSEWLPVKDAGGFAAAVFALYAQQEKIALPTPEALPAASDISTATELLRHTSDTIPAIVRDALVYSNNMEMETLALQATATKTPAEAGAKINEAIQAQLPNVGWTKFTFILPNASGLTDQARMTPGQCAALAAHAATASFNGVAFKSLMRGRKLDPFMADDDSSAPALRTKTGTIFYGRALAGITTGASGKSIAFCIMSNDQDQRQAYDALPFDQRDQAQYRDPAKAWLKAARDQEEALVKEWVAKF